MINTDMRLYNYFTFGADNGYGMPTLSDTPEGQIKMTINLSSQGIQDNVNYKQAQYIGLTLADVSDKFVIEYEGSRLKVLYVNPKGKYKQVFMSEI